MVEPPTLSQLSDSIPDFHQGNRNVTISEMDPSRCDLEPTEETEIDKNIDKCKLPENPSFKATTNVVVPLTTTKVKNCCLKMAGCGLITTSDLVLLDTYHKLIDIDSNFTTTDNH